MNIKRREPACQTLVGVFFCTQLPSEIPAWIEIEARVAEPGYYGQFDWQNDRIQGLLAQSVDFIEEVLPAYLSSLGFEGVGAVEWRTIDI